MIRRKKNALAVRDGDDSGDKLLFGGGGYSSPTKTAKTPKKKMNVLQILSPSKTKSPQRRGGRAVSRHVSEDQFSVQDWDLEASVASGEGDGFLDPVTPRWSPKHSAQQVSEDDGDWFSEFESEAEDSPKGEKKKKKNRKKKEKGSSKKRDERSSGSRKKDPLGIDGSAFDPESEVENDDDPLSLRGGKSSPSRHRVPSSSGRSDDTDNSRRGSRSSSGRSDDTDNSRRGSRSHGKKKSTDHDDYSDEEKDAGEKQRLGEAPRGRASRRPSLGPGSPGQRRPSVSAAQRRASMSGAGQRQGAHQATAAGRGNRRDRSRSVSRSRRSSTRGCRASDVQKSMLGPSHGDDEDEDADEIDSLFKSAQSEERQSILAKSRQGRIRSSGKVHHDSDDIPLEEIEQKAAARRASCVGYVPAGLHADKDKNGGKGSALDELFDKNSKGGGHGPSGAASVHGWLEGGYNPASMENQLSSGASCAGDFASRKKNAVKQKRHRHSENPELSSTIDGIVAGARKHRMDLKKSADSPRSHRAQLHSTTKAQPKKIATDTGGIVMPIAEEKEKNSDVISRLSHRRSSVHV